MGKEFRGGKGGGKRGGRGGNRGGRGGRGGVGSKKFAKPKTVVEPLRLDGVFTIKTGKEEILATKNLSPGESVYGEKRISVEEDKAGEEPVKIEYRQWNMFRSKLGAAIINGVQDIYMKPGSKVLYLGAANGTTISHVSDIVGENGIVYGVEISERSGRDLITMAKKRPNLVPIIDDARKPQNYGFLIPSLVDCIFSDVAQPDQARIIAMNAEQFLKDKGGFVFSIKANCVDSTAKPEDVFRDQIKILKNNKLYAKEQVTLEPFERGHAVVTGLYKPFKKSKEEEDKKEKKEDKNEDEDKKEKEKKNKGDDEDEEKEVKKNKKDKKDKKKKKKQESDDEE